MEDKSLNTDKLKIIKDHKVIIDNRKNITITSVSKAISANENSVILQLNSFKIYINGKNLHFVKLDIEQGIAELSGEIDGLKYSGTHQEQGFFKRIFK